MAHNRNRKTYKHKSPKTVTGIHARNTDNTDERICEYFIRTRLIIELKLMPNLNVLVCLAKIFLKD